MLANEKFPQRIDFFSGYLEASFALTFLFYWGWAINLQVKTLVFWCQKLGVRDEGHGIDIVLQLSNNGDCTLFNTSYCKL